MLDVRMKRARILLADDHDVVLEGVRRILDRPEFEVIGSVRDGWELVQAAQRLRPDVIVTDVSMPGLNGIEAARDITKLDSTVRIILLSMHRESAYAVEALHAGGSGYVLKDSASRELVQAIQEVRQGRVYFSPSIAESTKRALALKRRGGALSCAELTARQRQVLQLLAEGSTAKQIAEILHVSSRTVEFHKYRIMEALGIRNVAELTAYAMKNGLLA